MIGQYFDKIMIGQWFWLNTINCVEGTVGWERWQRYQSYHNFLKFFGSKIHLYNDTDFCDYDNDLSFNDKKNEKENKDRGQKSPLQEILGSKTTMIMGMTKIMIMG